MSLARIAIHSSQFPDNVRRDLLESLRSRQVNHKFHYDSVKQTQKWLALHEAYSPARTDPDCAAIYDRSYEAVAAQIKSPRVHVIGLGCGGGQKDVRLLESLRGRCQELFYTPCDVSAAMVLVARQTVARVIPEENCFPLVCDLATADDLPAVFDQIGPATSSSAAAPRPARLLTFFGMLPNFEPKLILPRLAGLIQREDRLLVSANLAPGNDYSAGLRRILPLYDNQQTRDWLMTFLLDLGVETGDGELRFVIEDEPARSLLKRVAGYFDFRRSREIRLESDRFDFQAGDSIRLFFSYRHTPDLVRTMLSSHGLEVIEQWVTHSEEEGVFLVASV